MANDFTIGKMYQFIHEYNNGGAYDSWVTAADANGDGTLIKSEFEQWIAEELPYWNGLEASEVRGTLNEFWYGLDINRSAKEIKGTRLNDLNALSNDEVKRMERIVQEMEEYNELLSQLEGPKNLNPENRIKWVHEMKEALGDNLDAWIQGGANPSYSIWEEYEKLVLEITPAIAVDDMQIDYNALFNYYNYDITTSSDKEVLVTLLEDYLVGKLTNIANDYKEQGGFAYGTVDQVETFVEQFMAEAFLDDNAGFVNNPHSDGFIANEFKTNFPGYSELQHNVLATDLYDFAKVDADWAPILASEGAAERSEIIEMMKAFTDKQLEGSSLEYKVHYDNILDTFKNDDKIQTEGVSYYFDKLGTTSNPAHKVIAEELKDVMGADSEALVDFYLKDRNDSVTDLVKDGVIRGIENAEPTDGVGYDSPEIKTSIVSNLDNLYYVEKLFASGYPADMSYEQTNALHDSRFSVYVNHFGGGVANLTGNETLHSAIIDSFVDYCNKLTAMGGIYAEAVEYVFNEFGIETTASTITWTIGEGDNKITKGGDATEAVNNTNQIEAFVEMIRNYVGQPSNWEKEWELPNLRFMDINETKTFSVAMNFTTGTGSSDNIVYTAECDNGTLKPLGNGEFELKAPGKVGTGTITIKASIGDTVIDTQTLTVEYVDETLNWNDWYDSLNKNDAFENAHGSHSGHGAYTNNKYEGEDKIRAAAIEDVTAIINAINDELATTKNYQKDALKYAKDCTEEFFNKLINAMHAHEGVANGEWSDTAIVIMSTGEEIEVDYTQESHQGYINADKNCFDGIKAQWNRGTMAGARFAKITVQNYYVYDMFSKFYNQYIQENG